MSAVEAASLSDVGRRRRANQDSCGEFPGQDGALLLVCCDGMGGHQGGEVASKLAVETIGAEFDAAAPEASLRQAFLSAHARVKARATERAELHGMGTTGVALYYDGNARAVVAHVGDSRCYRVRGGEIEQLTGDHSVVAELLRAGRLTPEQAATHPHNELSRAIGASHQLEVDCAEHDVREGDRFVLCSDGLWNLVEAREIAEAVLREAPAQAVRTLVDRANERGGTDNVTVQILGVGAAAAPEAPEEDDTERGQNEREALERARARKRVDETRAIALDGVNVDAIWEKAQAVARERQGRRIRAALIGAGVVTLALAAALAVWLGRGGA
jgi:protein phosphatase